jgi:hypothetical protein
MTIGFFFCGYIMSSGRSFFTKALCSKAHFVCSCKRWFFQLSRAIKNRKKDAFGLCLHGGFVVGFCFCFSHQGHTMIELMWKCGPALQMKSNPLGGELSAHVDWSLTRHHSEQELFAILQKEGVFQIKKNPLVLNPDSSNATFNTTYSGIASRLCWNASGKIPFLLPSETIILGSADILTWQIEPLRPMVRDIVTNIINGLIVMMGHQDTQDVVFFPNLFVIYKRNSDDVFGAYTIPAVHQLRRLKTASYKQSSASLDLYNVSRDRHDVSRDRYDVYQDLYKWLQCLEVSPKVASKILLAIFLVEVVTGRFIEDRRISVLGVLKNLDTLKNFLEVRAKGNQDLLRIIAVAFDVGKTEIESVETIRDLWQAVFR